MPEKSNSIKVIDLNIVKFLLPALFEVNYLKQERYRLNITAEEAKDWSKKEETMKGGNALLMIDLTRQWDQKKTLMYTYISKIENIVISTFSFNRLFASSKNASRASHLKSKSIKSVEGNIQREVWDIYIYIFCKRFFSSPLMRSNFPSALPSQSLAPAAAPLLCRITSSDGC